MARTFEAETADEAAEWAKEAVGFDVRVKLVRERSG